MMTDILKNSNTFSTFNMSSNNKVLINNVVFFHNCQFDSKATVFSRPFFFKEVSPFKIGSQDLKFDIFIEGKQFQFSFSLKDQLTFLNMPLKSISRVKPFFIFQQNCEYLFQVYVHPINKEIFLLRCRQLSPIK